MENDAVWPRNPELPVSAVMEPVKPTDKMPGSLIPPVACWKRLVSCVKV